MTTDGNVSGDLEFHLEEYRQLRSEIMMRSRLQLQMQVFTVIAIAFVFWFLVSNITVTRQWPQVAQGLAWWSLPLIVLAGYVWWRHQARSINQIGTYLITVEKHFGVKGWQQYLSELRLRRGISRNFFWIIVGLISIVVALLFSPSILGNLTRLAQ